MVVGERALEEGKHTMRLCRSMVVVVGSFRPPGRRFGREALVSEGTSLSEVFCCVGRLLVCGGRHIRIQMIWRPETGFIVLERVEMGLATREGKRKTKRDSWRREWMWV